MQSSLYLSLPVCISFTMPANYYQENKQRARIVKIKLIKNSLEFQAIFISIKNYNFNHKYQRKRNYRIAVPQYYKGKVTYLLPVTIDNQLMSVAVESINGRYRVNTIFTLEMAYKNARLLMKPEVDWITSVTKK